MQAAAVRDAPVSFRIERLKETRDIRSGDAYIYPMRV